MTLTHEFDVEILSNFKGIHETLFYDPTLILVEFQHQIFD